MISFRALSVAVFGSLFFLTCSVGSVAMAQQFTSENTGLKEAAKAAQYNTALTCRSQPGGCIPVFIGNAVNAMLGIFGAVFLVFIMWGGVQFLFAGGDSGKVKLALNTIRNAILGLLVVTASYAIASFVVKTIGSTTQTTGGATSAPIQ
jgi:hypothetical protein